ncbi:hypothetical protein [Halorientalis pallida]|uniref:DUF7981 domain-containing protein n=1 Tax=Halorientalis pallida TaxID=2479928 RepID=A0A498L2Z3_9EURY|nr:hypothetical protein [Halorientalis pallida]RXK50144.1 hypothetical protein EAF64_06160 [Halorientalis pallida]
MDPRVKSSLLWGLVGGLGFLVLLQGYELVSTERVAWLVKFAVAAAVVVGATGVSYLYQFGVPADARKGNR